MRRLAALVPFLVLLVGAPVAGAALTCDFTGATVTVTGEPDFALVEVDGAEIKVSNDTTTVDCGAATTSNTDTIIVQAPPDVAGNGSGHMPRIPGGLTDEPGTSDEIEGEVSGYPIGSAGGTEDPDTITAGLRGDGAAVVNSDAADDDEVDTVLTDFVFVQVTGAGGVDTVTADGSHGTGAPSTLIDVFGGAGTDTVSGAALVGGGAGDDDLIGLQGPGLEPVATFQNAPGGAEVQMPGGTAAGKDGHGSTDTFTGLFGAIGSSHDDKLMAGPGRAIFSGGQGDDELIGGPGEDFLQGGLGEDVLRGGGGDDDFVSTRSDPDGADVYEGGPGDFDRINYGDSFFNADGSPGYRGRTAPVFVTVGDGANDGEAGEGDDVQGDIEFINGGRGNDTLIGDDGPEQFGGLEGADTIDGRGGDDLIYGDGAEVESFVDAGNVIIGGAGKDQLIGSEGPDELRADDGEADIVTCGIEVDFGTFDVLDTLADDCEHRPATAPPPPASPPARPFPAQVGEPQLVRRGAPRLVRRRAAGSARDRSRGCVPGQQPAVPGADLAEGPPPRAEGLPLAQGATDRPRCGLGHRHQPGCSTASPRGCCGGAPPCGRSCG